ncbi:hypothetical protein NDU88_003200 [Pleurodeles waltl]|uniref:Uncharacterized protein n=1 Tax=Pleurodeles waltl TaxID=8319 RepID=A0AAV7Q8S9_PLEWA|nr:hypothetical protein NDU88_003200 [Pleurodeles waltl]
MKRRQPISTRHQPTYRGNPPTADEVLNERRQAMEAAARIVGEVGMSEAASPQSPQKEEEHSESDSETATSTQSSILLPVITPGTADEIICAISTSSESPSYKTICAIMSLWWERRTLPTIMRLTIYLR